MLIEIYYVLSFGITKSENLKKEWKLSFAKTINQGISQTAEQNYVHTLKSATIKIKTETNSLSQIVRQLNVSGKRMSKILIKRQHVEQTLPFNHVNVAVGESSHIGRRLTQGALPPEGVPEDVAHS